MRKINTYEFFISRAAADAPRMDFGTAFSLLWGSLTG